jgi:hypothetical protein
MRTKIAIAIILMGAQPALACHRFSRWYYPYPQRCSVRSPIVNIKQSIINTIVPVNIKKDDDMPIPFLDTWDVTERDAAIVKLRLQIEGKWIDKVITDAPQ